MPCDVVLGGQWGDEGKGKIVDYLATGAHAVVRCQGGANAGHTLVFGTHRLALHQVPSGVRHRDCLVVLGNGMVIDPVALLEEVDALIKAGIDPTSRIRVSAAAHVVLPVHRLQDQAEETRRGSAAVGTTGRGIGPAYADKAARRGLQMAAWARPAAELRAALDAALQAKRDELGDRVAFDPQAIATQLLATRDRIAPWICDTATLVQDAARLGKRLVLEGAQGALLDLDHGSYPFVTSSSCTSAGALVGCGLPPQAVDRVVGVVKAYATRVGNGPFPTELLDATGDRLRELGHEYGATTGRPRRCGWFDAAAVRRAARTSGFTVLALTKLDVLDDFDVVRIAEGYELDGKRIDTLPVDAASQARCQPVYVDVPGWTQSTRECASRDALPAAARRYVELVEDRVGVTIGIVSVGAERERTLAGPARRA
jgi:adenylosuccinate synthase